MLKFCVSKGNIETTFYEKLKLFKDEFFTLKQKLEETLTLVNAEIGKQ